VNHEAYLVGVSAYGWWRIAESKEAHSHFLAMRYELYAVSSFLRTRVRPFCASCGSFWHRHRARVNHHATIEGFSSLLIPTSNVSTSPRTGMTPSPGSQ